MANIKNNKNNSDKEPIIFKKTRGGIKLTKSEIKYIKSERKKLRKQMKEQGLKNRQDFEVTAASLGLYFDKSRFLGFLWWLKGRALWALLGALVALLAALFLASLVTQMRGHFTINLSSDLMSKGFLLSDTSDFKNPAPQLFSDPLEDAPCISIASIPRDITEYEGDHSTSYFAYSFFMKNESNEPVDYVYDISINSESKDLSKATWIMLFHNGKMEFYAEASNDGDIEAIPDKSVNDRGYPNIWLYDVANNTKQFEVVGTKGQFSYYRVLPNRFISENIIATGSRTNMQDDEVDKFTIVAWVEGDDPDCTDEMIDGHIGLEMNFRLINVDTYDEELNPWQEIEMLLDDLFKNLRFWNN